MSTLVRRATPRAEQPPAIVATATPVVQIWWTVEHGLYAAALLIGLGLRLFQLGNMPLSAWEASNVWPAWLAAQGQLVRDAPLPNSPLMYNLHWLTLALGIQGDATMRFWSALAGTVLVVTPWWLRGWLGRRAALATAFLFALDPWLLLFGRMADGAGLALLLGMATLAGLLHIVQGRPNGGRMSTVVAVCGGLLLVSGPMGWNLLPVVLVTAWLYRRELAEARCDLRSMAAVVALAAVAGGTLALIRLDGLQWLSSGLSVWLGQFDGRPAGPLQPTIAAPVGVGWPWLRLLVDNPLAALLGVAGMTLLWLATPDRRTRLLTGWLAWGVILWLLPGRSPLALPVAGLALDMLAAIALTRLAAGATDVLWREAMAVWLTLAIMVASGWIQATTFGSLPVLDVRLGQTVLVVAALIIAIVVSYGFWAGRAAAGWIAVVAVTAALALLTVRSSAALVQERAAVVPAGRLVLQTDPEVRTLAEDVKTLSAHRLGDETEAAVQVQVAAAQSLTGAPAVARPDPLLGWYLRDMRNLTWVAAPHLVLDAPPPLVVMVNGETFVGDESISYIGSDYDVEVYWQPGALSAAPVVTENSALAERLWPPVRAWWRWWVYGEVSVRPATRTVTLWAPVGTAAAE